MDLLATLGRELREDVLLQPPDHHCLPGCRVQGSGLRVQGAGFRVQGAGCRVQGAGFRVQSLGCRVQVSGLRAQGSGFKVQGAGCKVQGRHWDRPRHDGVRRRHPPPHAAL